MCFHFGTSVENEENVLFRRLAPESKSSLGFFCQFSTRRGNIGSHMAAKAESVQSVTTGVALKRRKE